MRPRYLKRTAKQSILSKNGNGPLKSPVGEVSKVSNGLAAKQTSNGNEPESRSPPREPISSKIASQHGQRGASPSIEINKNAKRKHATLEDAIPLSSISRPNNSPKRKKIEEGQPPPEVASTPDISPARSQERPNSPLFVSSGDEDGEDKDIRYENGLGGSPLGKQPSDTLSEPGNKMWDTQAILNDPTQQIDFKVPPPHMGSIDQELSPREDIPQLDFDVPPPEEGWDNLSPGSGSPAESDSTVTNLQNLQSVAQDTQGILRGKTPALDFDVADPEGGWDHVIPSSPPPVSSSPFGESEISDVDAKVEAWINAQVDNGASLDTVLMVLKAASIDMILAEDVLRSMPRDGELPTNRKGIWTESDDEDLHATDARRILRLEQKHGEDCITARWEFLSCYGSS